jgi:flagellar basal-body rod protein FlgG
MRSLNIAATGMNAQQLNVDTTSHNLANMTTTGYKRQRAEFQDLIYQDLKRAGANSSDNGTVVPTGVQVGLGVKTGAIFRNHSQGTVQQTEGPLDVAMQGRGFFKIQMPDGSDAYTRDGTFQLSPDGQIVTSDGYIVQPNITVPNDAISVSISATGVVEIMQTGQIAPTEVGQLQLVTFINEPGLQAQGNNLYTATAASGDPIEGLAGDPGFGSILQGYVENSNVDPVTEVTDLIVAQRAYEMNSKVISASDEMLQALAQSA